MSGTTRDLTLVDVAGLKRLAEALSEPPIIEVVGRHLSDDEFVGYAAGRLPEDLAEQVDAHLAGCEECAREMDRIVSACEILLQERELLLEAAITAVFDQLGSPPAARGHESMAGSRLAVDTSGGPPLGWGHHFLTVSAPRPERHEPERNISAVGELGYDFDQDRDLIFQAYLAARKNTV